MKKASLRLSRVQSILVGACAAWAFLCLGARSAYYGLPSVPEALQPLVGYLNGISARAFFGVFNNLPVSALPVAVFMVLFVVQRRACIRRCEGRISLARWWHPVLWAELAWNQPGLDLNPRIASAGWLALPVAAGLTYLRLPGRSRTVVLSARAIAWGVVIGVGIWSVHAASDVFGVVAWGAWVLALLLPGQDRILPRDRLLLAVLGLPAVQIATSSHELLGVFLVVLVLGAGGWLLVSRRARMRRILWIPAIALLLLAVGTARPFARALFDHGGEWIGEGGAYSFCEMPERHKVYAAVPNCATTEASCRDGFIAEFDAGGRFAGSAYPIFDQSFYGRLEHIACIGDTVQVGMCCTGPSGAPDDEATLTWFPDSPERYLRHGPEAQGRRLVFDREHDAVFYVGDHLHRVERATGASSTVVEERILEAAGRRPGLPKTGVFTADTESIDPERNRIFIAELGQGTGVYEIDLDSLEVVRQWELKGGGMPSATVDVELGRLYVIGIFGLEVIDLESGATVARVRTGTMPRPPVVDRVRNVFYVPTTIGGRIHVFDRLTLEGLGEIPIGIDVRHGLLTSDQRWLFASNSSGQYMWDAEELASRFGR